jgi:hypothetical protein
MTRQRWLAALGVFLAPLLLRSIWFYPGTYTRPEPVATPDYPSFQLSRPPLGPAVPSVKAEPGGETVLIDWAHQNNFSVPELQTLYDALAEHGGRTEVMTVSYDFSALPLEERLKSATAYIVAAASLEFTPGEIQAVERFVRRGGRLLVISDPTRGLSMVDPLFYFPVGATFGDVAAANALLAPHGLAFSQDYLYNLRDNEGNFRNVLVQRFADHELTQGLAQLAFYAARSVETHGGLPLLLGDGYTYSSRDDRGGSAAAAALSADGRVLALGDLTFLTPPYNEVADNATWIDRLAEFLLADPRPRTLEDFPYLFTQPVAVRVSDLFPLDAENLRALAQSQAALGLHGQPVTAAEEAPPGTDQVVLSLFEADPELGDLLGQFDLTLPRDSDRGLLEIGGLPAFDPTGVGVLLLAQVDRGAVLLLMAESESDLISLFDLLNQRSLSGCYVQAGAALCQISAGDFDGFDEGLGFPEPFFEGTPFELPSATPFP